MNGTEDIEYKALKINSGDLDKSLIIEILEYYMIFLACFPTFIFRYFIPLTLIPIARRYAKNKFVFSFFNLCILAFTCFIGTFGFSKDFTKLFLNNSIAINIVFVVYFFILIIISYLKRNPNNNRYFVVSHFALLELLVACWELFLNYTKNYGLKEFCLFSGLIIAFLYSVYIYSSRSYVLDNFKKISDKKQNIKKYKLKIMVSFAVIISVLGLISIKISDVLSPIIEDFFRYNDEEAKPIKHAVKNSTDSMKMNFLSKLGPTTKLSKYIGEIISILFSIIAALIIIFLVVLTVKAIYNKLHEKKIFYKKSNIDDDEKAESILSIDDINNNIKDLINKIKNKVTLNIKRSNKEKIRRMYHRGILKHKIKDAKVLKFQTPMEIKETVEKENSVNLGEITKIYEKARYSEAECSDEDVKIFKKL